MVAAGARNDDRRAPDYCSTSRQSSIARKRGDTSSTQETKTMYLSAIRRVYEQKGLSSKSTDIILRSWRKNTVNQYTVYMKMWFAFARQGLKPTLRNVIEFLTHLSGKGYNYNQLCAARSAVVVLSEVRKPIIGKASCLKTFYEGHF